ncbi:hypothetical protein GWO43_16000 [candidate division KSB1 bacterium]|nr:hypothetical protein [candidate division KSB1 bacterium]NIV68735.1 hypothetical protein [Phycisphaerae bacterium]NIS25454.1 hypothetical protein [candidate division KSB1 bacterium]NIT72346.1 hypothetical protein [candidate division KSB1 bacterium]NIU26131.1 hypothetical protein [candidate division KSB1 bacterium]
MTPRASDWAETATGSDNAEATLEHSAGAADRRHKLTFLSAGFDDTANAALDLYGLSKVGPMDLTDTAVLDLTADTFTVSGHGLANADKVVFHTLGGTAPTGLTSGNTYFVVGVSGDDFQLESSVGGGAIDMSGTQANFATEALILPLSKSFPVYDHLEVALHSPLNGVARAPLILKLAAGGAGIAGKLNMAGYTL